VETDDLHRRAVRRLRAGTARRIAELWRLYFDPDDIEGSWQRFFPVAVPVVMAGYEASSYEAQDYLAAIRREQEAPGRNFEAPPLDRVRVEKALGYTARVGALVGLRMGRAPREALDVALVRTMGATQRFVTEGSNAAVRRTLREDPRATGWRRIAASDACDFCAALASNGVYSHKVDFSAHDHCACTARPVFGERPTARRPRSTVRATSEPGPRPAPASSSLSDRVAAQRTFAEGAGWDVRTSGSRMIGTKAGGQRIVWELTESGVWRIEQLSRS